MINAIENAVELTLGGYNCFVNRDELAALKPVIAALWQPITDFRDPAFIGEGRWELSARTLNGSPCPAYGATNDMLLAGVRSLQVGPDGDVAGWHIWRRGGRFLCERV